MPEESRPPEWSAAEYERNKRQFVEKRALLRPITLHAGIIFAVTGAAGWLCSRLLLGAGLHSLPARYAMTFVVAYAVFALCVRVWADFMRTERDGSLSGWDMAAADASGEGCLLTLGALVVGLLAATVFALMGGVPLLLEVAFEVVFAGAVVRRFGRRQLVGDWSGRLLRGTWLPAALLAFALVVVAGWLQRRAPEAVTLVQALRVVFPQLPL